MERSINGTFGVERLLVQGGEPQPVPHGVVESLVTSADAEGNVDFHNQLREPNPQSNGGPICWSCRTIGAVGREG